MSWLFADFRCELVGMVIANDFVDLRMLVRFRLLLMSLEFLWKTRVNWCVLGFYCFVLRV